MDNQNVEFNKNGISNIEINNNPEIQVGDYVIAMCKNPVTLSREISYSPTGYIKVEVGILFKVIKINDISVFLEDFNNGFVYDIIQLRRCRSLNLADGLYIFRTNLNGYFGSDVESLCVINRPEAEKSIKGSQLVYVTLTNDSLYSEDHLIPRRYEDLALVRVPAVGYLAHVDCFDKRKSKPLFDLSDEYKDEYLGRKK